MRRVLRYLAPALATILLCFPAVPAFATGTLTLSVSAVDLGYTPTLVKIQDTLADFSSTTPPSVFLLNSSGQAVSEVAGVSWVNSEEVDFTLEPGLPVGAYTVDVRGVASTPTLTVVQPSLSPTSITAGYTQPAQFTVQGADFTQGTAVSLLDSSGNVVPNAVSAVQAGSSASLSFNLATGIGAGNYEVSISGVSQPLALLVQSATTTLSPDTYPAGYIGQVSITATGNANTTFQNGTTVGFVPQTGGTGALATGVSSAGAQNLSFYLPAGLGAGAYTVTMTTGTQQVDADFTVSPAPTFSISPQNLTPGYTSTTLAITGTGTNFSGSSTVALSDASGTSESTYLGPPQFTSATAGSVVLKAGLPAGTYSLAISVSGMTPMTQILTISSSGGSSGSGTGTSGGGSSGTGSGTAGGGSSSGAGSGSGGGSQGSSGTPSAGTLDATAATTQASQGTTTVWTLSMAKLSGQLGSDQTVLVKASADNAELVLPAQAVQALTQDHDTVEFSAPDGTYVLPLQSLPLAQLAAELKVPSGTDLSLEVGIQPAPSSDLAALVKAFGSSSAVVAPVRFTVMASANGNSVPVGTLNGLAESTLVLPAGTTPGPDLVGVELVNGVPQHARTSISGSNMTFYAASDPTFAVATHQTSFSDIAGLPQAAAIQALADQLVTSGTTATTFDPQGGVSREQFAALLIRALGLWNVGSQVKFKDITANSWAAPMIKAAVAEGFIQGYPDGNFKPSAPITNEQMAAMMARAMSYLGIQSGSNTVKPTDLGTIPGWAGSDVALVLSQGIMTTDAHGAFDPNQVTTRAVTAQIIWNLMQKAGIQ